MWTPPEDGKAILKWGVLMPLFKKVKDRTPIEFQAFDLAPDKAIELITRHKTL